MTGHMLNLIIIFSEFYNENLIDYYTTRIDVTVY